MIVKHFRKHNGKFRLSNDRFLIKINRLESIEIFDNTLKNKHSESKNNIFKKIIEFILKVFIFIQSIINL